jgi:hypothetical protein
MFGTQIMAAATGRAARMSANAATANAKRELTTKSLDMADLLSGRVTGDVSELRSERPANITQTFERMMGSVLSQLLWRLQQNS